METLLSTQAHLIRSLEDCQQFLFKTKKIVKTYTSRLKRDHVKFQRNPEHYLGNPINAFTLITRLSRDLSFLESLLNHGETGGMCKINKSLVYPTNEDYKRSFESIILLQRTYGLDISQLANGTLSTRYSKYKERFLEYVTPITASDCYDLAMVNAPKNRIRHIVAWLEEAYKRYEKDRLFCSFTEEEIVESIAEQYYKMENWNKTVHWLERLLVLRPDDFFRKKLNNIRKLIKASHNKSEIQNLKNRKLAKGEVDIDTKSTNKRLCCDDESSSIAIDSSLYCYYAHGPHPYLRLAPFRAELLYREPNITMFYDVVSDAEIQFLKTYAKPRLYSSKVYEEGGSFKVSVARISEVAWLPHNTTEVEHILNHIRQFTGLKFIQHWENSLNIANYGTGGYYVTHGDFMDAADIVEGFQQRFASSLIYFSNVEQGGATIFVNLNLTIFPVKNAAVFWFNLDTWGNPDHRTRHSACPVLRGSKWVATHWIRLFEQDLSWICPTYPPVSEMNLGQTNIT